MKNTITRTECPKLFAKGVIGDLEIDCISEHRRGSSFYTKSIIEISEEDNEWLKVENISDLIGYWITNQYMSDDEFSSEWDEIDTLTRVEQKERVITETYWEEVK